MATKTKKSSNVYVSLNEQGVEVESKSPNENWTGVRIKFENGNVANILRDSLPASIMACAAAQGISIKVQRSGAETKTVDEFQEAAETTIENLLAGVWNTEREGSGPRISDLLEAVVKIKTDAGVTVTDEVREAIRGKLLTEEGRAVAQGDKTVQMHVEQMKADRARERAKKAKEEAKGVKSALADF